MPIHPRSGFWVPFPSHNGFLVSTCSYDDLHVAFHSRNCFREFRDGILRSAIIATPYIRNACVALQYLPTLILLPTTTVQLFLRSLNICTFLACWKFECHLFIPTISTGGSNYDLWKVVFPGFIRKFTASRLSGHLVKANLVEALTCTYCTQIRCVGSLQFLLPF